MITPSPARQKITLKNGWTCAVMARYGCEAIAVATPQNNSLWMSMAQWVQTVVVPGFFRANFAFVLHVAISPQRRRAKSTSWLACRPRGEVRRRRCWYLARYAG